MQKLVSIHTLLVLALCCVQSVFAVFPLSAQGIETSGPVRAWFEFVFGDTAVIATDGLDPYRHAYVCEDCPQRVKPQFSIPIAESQRNAFALVSIQTVNNFGQNLEDYSPTQRKLANYPFNSFVSQPVCRQLALGPLCAQLPVAIPADEVKYCGDGRLLPLLKADIAFVPNYGADGKLKSLDIYHDRESRLARNVKGLAEIALFSSYRFKYHKNGGLKEATVKFLDFEGDWANRRILFNENGTKMEEVVKAAGNAWRYKCDAAGNIVEKYMAKDAAGNYKRHTFVYDAKNRLLQHDFLLNNACVCHESFDRFGNRVERIELSEDGNVTSGSCRVYEYFDEYNYRTEDDDAFAQLKVGGLQDTVFGRQYVDMGLPSGNLWSTCNMGTHLPVRAGKVVLWNGVKGPRKTGSGTCLNGLRRLTRAEDTVAVSWGGAWCMPTYVDFQELVDYCKWEYVRDYKGTGIYYYRIEGPNGQSMVLPVKDSQDKDAGIRNYWTANCNGNGAPLAFNTEEQKLDHTSLQQLACVRPVIHKYRYIDTCVEYSVPVFKYPSDRYCISSDCYNEKMPSQQQDKMLERLVVSRKRVNTEYVDLGLSVLWAKCNVGASDSLGLGVGSTTGEDVAAAVMGGNWRMPTSKEFKELLDNCTVKRCTYGLLFTSKVEGYTNKSIMLPFVLGDNSSYNLDYLSSVANEGLSSYSEYNANMPPIISNMRRGYVRAVCPKRAK